MDQIFDRLGDLLRSVLRGDDRKASQTSSFSDPDMQAAWDELNDFMNAEQPGHDRPASSTLPPKVRDAFAVIGVDPAAGNEEIAKAYKSLLLKNHPDRFATDPARQTGATERTKRINQAFQLIKEYRSDRSR